MPTETPVPLREEEIEELRRRHRRSPCWPYPCGCGSIPEPCEGVLLLATIDALTARLAAAEHETEYHDNQFDRAGRAEAESGVHRPRAGSRGAPAEAWRK